MSWLKWWSKDEKQEKEKEKENDLKVDNVTDCIKIIRGYDVNTIELVFKNQTTNFFLDTEQNKNSNVLTIYLDDEMKRQWDEIYNDNITNLRLTVDLMDLLVSISITKKLYINFYSKNKTTIAINYKNTVLI